MSAGQYFTWRPDGSRLPARILLFDAVFAAVTTAVFAIGLIRQQFAVAVMHLRQTKKLDGSVVRVYRDASLGFGKRDYIAIVVDGSA